MPNKIKLKIKNKTIKTAHGIIKTPFFMPDATRGFLKTLGSEDLKNLKIGAMVVNTFHLYLQPGIKTIKKAGGIHKFMNWNGPLLSDSGGYQVFSLIHKNSKMGKITDEGAFFTSPINGSRHMLTPEKSIQIQFDLGVDMMVCLDDCPPNDFDGEKLKKAVERTIEWAKRCKREYEKQLKKRKIANNKRPLIFSVIQGGRDLKLRKYCAEELIEIGFDGYGFGARHIDGEGNFMADVLKKTAEMIPADSLRFALGVGRGEDIVKCASYGWDMFDCVIPTREGRHGRLFYRNKNLKLETGNFYKTINISNSKFANDFSPINKDSKIKELREYSKAFLNHLFKLREPLGQRLASLNNLEFYMELMRRINSR